ncbi:MAG: ABC transporter ATP-binding protein [Epsilonproteobacteria bacterium]|nr:ABC transporter ATP-binding protein [Campylobacterota bacterium]
MKINQLKITSEKTILVDISFEIKHALALVGQSGSGKSLTLKALLGMTPPNLHVSLDIEDTIDQKMISLVPQNPFTALSPLTKIKKHFTLSQSKITALLESVGLDSSLVDRYPPELSGGQLQRVVIALALENRPKLLLLDEPTTALDPKTTDTILKLLVELQKKMGFLILYVTHEMATVAKICEEICVIKEGKIVEMGKTDDILKHPKEPYTKQLIEANFFNRDFRK